MHQPQPECACLLGHGIARRACMPDVLCGCICSPIVVMSDERACACGRRRGCARVQACREGTDERARAARGAVMPFVAFYFFNIGSLIILQPLDRHYDDLGQRACWIAGAPLCNPTCRLDKWGCAHAQQHASMLRRTARGPSDGAPCIAKAPAINTRRTPRKQAEAHGEAP